MIRRWTLSLAVALVLVALAAVAALAARQGDRLSGPQEENLAGDLSTVLPQAPQGAYLWNYSAKFVCGYQAPLIGADGLPAPGEPVVKPGNYATEINIHNYNYKEVPVIKKLLFLVQPSPDGKDAKVIREPQTTGPVKHDKLVLGPDFATMDDCNRFWQWVYPGTVPPVPFPLMVGYLVVLSPVDLDIDAVYTASTPGTAGTESRSLSIDVERVPGKRVFVPAGALP